MAFYIFDRGLYTLSLLTTYLILFNIIYIIRHSYNGEWREHEMRQTVTTRLFGDFFLNCLLFYFDSVRTINPMANNALQAQLLKAGLVDAKKAKKINQQQQHAKKTGQDQTDVQIRQALILAQQEKLAKDQALNRQRQQELEHKTAQANIKQMLTQHQLKDTQGDVSYQFIDQQKIKKIYITATLYQQIVAGHVWIAQLDGRYVLLPRPLGERIEQRAAEVIVVKNSLKHQNTNDKVDVEDDPYAAYVIPDDLMW